MVSGVPLMYGIVTVVVAAELGDYPHLLNVRRCGKLLTFLILI